MQVLPFSHLKFYAMPANFNHTTHFTCALVDSNTLVLFLINHLPSGTFTASNTLPGTNWEGVGAIWRAG